MNIKCTLKCLLNVQFMYNTCTYNMCCNVHAMYIYSTQKRAAQVQSTSLRRHNAVKGCSLRASLCKAATAFSNGIRDKTRHKRREAQKTKEKGEETGWSCARVVKVANETLTAQWRSAYRKRKKQLENRKWRKERENETHSGYETWVSCARVVKVASETLTALSRSAYRERKNK